MTTTIELRWFCQGMIPAVVKHWFDNDCPGEWLGQPEEREDLYLHITPKCDYLNLKLRQGRLEVKWRKAELGIRRFGNAWEGHIEQWGKWMCEDPEQQSFLPHTIIEQEPWISVYKKRRQRLYQLPSTSQSCSVELTQLKVAENLWWSLAFEAAEIPPDLMDSLQNTIHAASQTYQGSELKAQNSYAYPHWLALTV
jgi:hypothetical protein